MSIAPLHDDEDDRIAAVHTLGLLDAETEEEFDALADAAALVCKTPVSYITLIERERVWFVASVGTGGAREGPRELSFCPHTILGDQLLEVEDATVDERFRDNAGVTGPPGIRFYAAVPLRLSDGQAVGTLCVVDFEPRRLSTDQRRVLKRLGQAAVAGMEMRRARRAAEEAAHTLSLSRAHWQTVVENLHEGFIVGEAVRDTQGAIVDWRYVDVNEAWTQMVGIPAASAVGRSVREVLPGIEPFWVDLGRRAVGDSVPVTFEHQVETLDRWYEGRATGLGGERFLISFNDVTERVRGQRQLEALTSSLSQQVAQRTLERDKIWNVSTDMFCVADEQGVWLSANPAWTRVLGWTQEELLGRTSEWMEHPDDVARTRAEIAGLSAGRMTPAFTNRFRARSGVYHWLSWTAVVDGGVIYAIARDISGEREHAKALHHAQESLRQSQKMEAVGQLTGGIAHDFNNLLGTIRNAIEIIRQMGDAPRPGEVARFSEMAMRSVDRAASLTQRLLAFSRKQPLKFESVDVNRLVVELEDILARMLGRNIKMAIKVEPDLWPAHIDGNQLESALLNLVINARDAMNGFGMLSIETNGLHVGDAGVVGVSRIAPGDYVVVSVSDDGSGMTPEVLARAFDPFFTTKPMGQGTGLGLSMIYGFTRQSGGTATIFSQPGVGTTVKLFLPRAASNSASSPPSATETPTLPQHGNGERVLVVEDEEDLRAVIIELLRAHGFEVDEARTAEDALAKFEAGAAVDVLVTDIRLPGINGRVLMERARATRPALPVLLMTGYDTRAAAPGDKLDERTALLTKPFGIERLIAEVNQLARIAAR